MVQPTRPACNPADAVSSTGAGGSVIGRRRWLAGLAALGAAAGPCRRAHAERWPVRPVQVVVPYAPGGAMDNIGRQLADLLRIELGQPVLVANRPGAGGVVGSMAARHASPDGHTLLLSNTGAMVAQPVLKRRAPYDPTTDFTPIAKLCEGASFIGADRRLPFQSVEQLVAAARRQPGALNYTTPGIGSLGHFIGESLRLSTGIDIVHVPSRSSAEAVNEVLAGRIQLIIDAEVARHHVAGTMRALATTAPRRLETHPDIPTVRESGGPELVMSGWFGLFGPPGLPRSIVARLAAALRVAGSAVEVRQLLASYGFQPSFSDATSFAAEIAADLLRFREIAGRARLAVD